MIIKQNYAPFGALSSKRQKNKQNRPLFPGPGSYDVSLPIISPAIRTIEKPNNNVIVKLGHIGTSSFQCNKERFEQQTQSGYVGPGAYIGIVNKRYATIEGKRERCNAASRLRELIKNPVKRSPTISEIKKVEFENEIEMPNRTDKIVDQQKEKKKIRGISWSRLDEHKSQTLQRNQEMISNAFLSPLRKSIEKNCFPF